MEITCLIVEDEPLARKSLETQVKRTPKLTLLASFEDALEAIRFMEKNQVDLLISDIAMPDMDGLSMLKSLSHPPVAILISAHPEYAYEAYGLDVIDYIGKPYSYERFLKGIHKAENAIELNRSRQLQDHYLKVKDRGQILMLAYSDIQYIQGSGDYIDIKTEEKAYVTPQRLKEIEKNLPSQFIRVHKSFIVNVDFIKSIAVRHIIMKPLGLDIPIGKSYRNGLFRHLGIK